MRSYRRRAIGFYTDKGKRKPITKRKRHFVKPRKTRYRIKKVIPELEEDKMNKVAREMGYEKTTDVPYDKIDEFSKKLVERYGARESFYMAHAQVIFRKNKPKLEADRKKFEAIRESIDKQYDWRKVNGYRTIKVIAH
jgi:K+ transporter